MARPVQVTVPHVLGKEEARRRIEEGFSGLQQQMTGGMFPVSLVKRWECDRMHFEGGVLGQKITGRMDVLDDRVQVEVDLPELLATIAGRIAGNLKQQTRKLLERK